MERKIIRTEDGSDTIAIPQLADLYQIHSTKITGSAG